jgi:hypothetical protein
VAWVAVVAGVAGAAVLGAPMSQAPAPTNEVASSAPSTASARPVQVDQPARQGDVVTTRDIIVRGQVAEGVAQVWITLESGGRPIATETIDPIGMPRNALIPFETRFKVHRPRPAGPLFVMVVAIDADGVPIDAMRRRFMLGEWLELRGPIRNASPAD